MTYEQTWFDPQPWRYEQQFRCKICPDAIGEVADVSAPDGWLLDGDRVLHEEAPGINFAIARTERGADLVQRAAAAGFLELAPLDADELERVHPDHLPRKLGWFGTKMAMHVMRQRTIAIRNYRTLRTIRRAGARVLWRQARGTVRRVLRGNNRESPI